MTTGRMLGRLARDRRGAAATVFALAVPGLIGAAALAVDTANYFAVRSRMQAAADAAALAAVGSLDTPDQSVADAVEFAARNVPDSYGTVATAADVEIGIFSMDGGFVPGGGADANAVRILVERSVDRGNAALPILSFILGETATTIRASAVAARQLRVQYQPPERINLDNEAGDFNEIYAYCYDPDGGGTRESRRSQMTLVSNNLPAGTDVGAFTSGVVTENPPETVDWPQCDVGETLSFRLRNVRHAKSLSSLWANPGQAPGRPEHNYFTDTEIENGVEQFDLGYAMLETKRCDTADSCDVPRGRNRTAGLEDQPCMPGKFMYFGWEDRPPGQPGASSTWTDPAWTDRDFDDIVIVLKCPSTGRLGDGLARLVQ
jgi:Flp pilus assembly protein TadG